MAQAGPAFTARTIRVSTSGAGKSNRGTKRAGIGLRALACAGSRVVVNPSKNAVVQSGSDRLSMQHSTCPSAMRTTTGSCAPRRPRRVAMAPHVRRGSGAHAKPCAVDENRPRDRSRQVILTSDTDERALEAPRHVFDEARLTAAGGTFEHYRELLPMALREHLNLVPERQVERLFGRCAHASGVALSTGPTTSNTGRCRKKSQMKRPTPSEKTLAVAQLTKCPWILICAPCIRGPDPSRYTCRCRQSRMRASWPTSRPSAARRPSTERRALLSAVRASSRQCL